MNDADHALVARDTGLPGLALLLDEEALLDEIGRQMPAADIARIRIDYLRYKPGTSCMAGLRVIDTLGRTQHAFARALTASNPDWEQHAARLQKRAALDGRFSAHVLPRMRLLLASAVHDRRITALGTLLNTPGTLGGTDPLPDDLGIDQHLYEREIQAHVLRYKPERRMVLQLRQGSRPVGVLRACTEREFPATEAGARLARAFQGRPLGRGATRHFWSCPGSAARAWTCWAATPHAPCRSCLHTAKCHRQTCPSWTWASLPTSACAWANCTKPASRTPCTVPWPMTSMP